MRVGYLAIGVVLFVSLGCERTEVRTGSRELATLEPDAVRVLVSSDGIGRLVEVANPDGFTLDADAVVPASAPNISLGPLAQVLSVSSRTSLPQTEAIELSTRFDGATIFVPVRIHSLAETRVCRWRVDASQISTEAILVLVDGAEGQEFGVQAPPTISISAPQVTPIDDCSDLDEELPDEFEEVLIDYVTDAVAIAAARTVPSSPLDTLGVLRGNVRITRTSVFPSRSGTLVIESDVSPRSDALTIGAGGLSISIDAAAEADRARCSPPTAINVPAGNGAQPLNPADLERLNADFALALSASWLGRVAQGATLAGYSCVGLEDARHAEVNDEVVPTADLLLEEINLDHVPVGPFATLTLAPGSLPVAELRPDQGIVQITWDDLQIEVYVEIFGARTRIVRIVADAELGLSPTAQVVGVAKFQLESISVTTDRLDSQFLAVTPAQEAIDRWVQRTLLNMLEESFEFPLPITPVSPVRVISMQVRDDDIVTYMRFD